MTTYNVYKNLPFNVKIFKDKYWDMTINKSISENMTETVNLIPYDGVNAEINHNASAPLLFIDAGTLPDNSVFGATKGCLMPEGSDYLITSSGYYDIPCSGGLTVNCETGLAEGFSASCTISLGRCLEGTDYTLIQKASFDGEAREQTIWLADGGKNVGINTNKLGVYGTEWTLGESELEAGIYWFRASYQNRVFKLYRLSDDDETYTLDTLPAVSDWVEEVIIEDCDNPLLSSSFVKISRDSASYWGGKMYLDGSAVYLVGERMILPFPKTKKEIYPGIAVAGLTLDGQAHDLNIFYKDKKFVADTAAAKTGYRWCGEAALRAVVPSGVLKKKYTETGTLSFSCPNLSGFSAAKYIIADNALPVNTYFANDLKIICRCTVKNVTTSQVLLCSDAENSRGFGIRYNDWRLIGSSDVYGGNIQSNKTYWVQVIQEDGNGTKLYYLLDDGTYTLDTLPALAQWTSGPTTTEALFGGAQSCIRIGAKYNNANEYWMGNIDLLSTCVYSGIKNTVTGETAWTVHWKPFA